MIYPTLKCLNPHILILKAIYKDFEKYAEMESRDKEWQGELGQDTLLYIFWPNDRCGCTQK